MRVLCKNILLSLLIMNLLSACGESNSELISKKWKVTELDLSGTKLTGDQVNMIYEFNQDGTFSRSENGQVEAGSWKLSEDGKSLTLNFNNKEVQAAEKAVEQLTKDKLVISGEEFSMQRTLTMVPAESK